MAAAAVVAEAALKEVGRRAVGLHGEAELSGLVEMVKGARVVMLGEASHGTHEFYEWRARISQQLIEDHGFEFVAVEGDWPAAQSVNRNLLLPSSPPSPVVVAQAEAEAETDAGAVLRKAFRRWPSWMWANQETLSFLSWLRRYNSRSSRRVRFYGLDLYSLFESIDVVLSELQKLDPALAEKANKEYACFHRFDRDEQEYMRSLAECPEGCKAQAIRVLLDVRRKRFRVKSEEEEDVVRDVRQNAKIAADAERYYRTVMFGASSSESWNVRDRHMMDTLDLLLRHHHSSSGGGGGGIVWAHNTHIGDYRYTSMLKQGSVNLGGLARQRYGDENVALVGLGTYQGSVVASNKWTGPVLKLRVPEARPDSFEGLLHRAAAATGQRQFYLLFGGAKGSSTTAGGHRGINGGTESEERDGHGEQQQQNNNNAPPSLLLEWRGNRAIGVVYEPLTEKWGNYVPTCLARRYDAFLFFDTSRALLPLTDEYDVHEVPEAWPTGV